LGILIPSSSGLAELRLTRQQTTTTTTLFTPIL
jgi:hypothetical protein